MYIMSCSRPIVSFNVSGSAWNIFNNLASQCWTDIWSNFSILDLLNDRPLVMLEIKHLHGFPINGVNFSLTDITHSWDSEWEAFSVKLHRWLLQDICVGIEVPRVTEESSAKPSQNNDRISVSLASSISLTWWDRDRSRLWRISAVNDLPLHVKVVKRCLDIKSLNIVEVLFVLILNSTEDIYILSIELATWVIVTTIAHISKLGPLVLYDVKKLNFVCSTLGILSGTCDDYVLISKCCHCMTMSWVGHFWLLLQVERVVCWIPD